MPGRRQYLKGVGVSASLVAGLSGCLGGDGGDSTPTEEPGDGSTPTEDEGGGSTPTEETGGEDFPSRTVSYMVPWGPGGGSDTYARGKASALSAELGVPVRIENIGGSSGLRGHAELMTHEPNGYMFGSLSVPARFFPALIRDYPHDLSEYEAIGTFARTPWVICSHSEHGVEDFADLKSRYENGDFTNIGGLGIGSGGHIATTVLKNQADLNYENYVPYDGCGSTAQAIASGEIPAGVCTDAGLLSAVESGNAEPVLACPTWGSSVFPDAETLGDYGTTDQDWIMGLYRILVTTPGTPSERVGVLESALETTLESDSVQTWAEDTGNKIVFEPSDTAQQRVNDAGEKIRDQIGIDTLRDYVES